MAYSIKTFVGNGVTTMFAITFEYLENNDIYVMVNDSIQTEGLHYTISNSQVVFVTPPPNDSSVEIFRQTDVDALKVTWRRGGGFREENLTLAHKQLLFLIQEVKDSLAYAVSEGQLPTPEDLPESAPTLISRLFTFLITHTSTVYPDA